MDLSGVPSNLRGRASVDGSQVDLRDLKLTSVPEWLEGLVTVTSLDLSGNELLSVPEWLAGLTSLVKLNLSDNQLASLPESLGDLTTLTSWTWATISWHGCPSH